MRVTGLSLVCGPKEAETIRLKAWDQVVERGYEGLVAKDLASSYRGGRTLAWLKVKVPKYREGERGWEAKPSDRG